MSAPILTEEKIRNFMMDKPELNTLIQGVRFKAEDIDDASILAVDYFNMASPPTGDSYSIETFPFAYLLLMGTCGILLRGASIQQASNNLSYAAGDVQVNDQDKAEIFMKLGSEFWNEFKEHVRQVKLNQNISNAYGVKYSEYIFRAR